MSICRRDLRGIECERSERLLFAVPVSTDGDDLTSVPPTVETVFILSPMPSPHLREHFRFGSQVLNISGHLSELAPRWLIAQYAVYAHATIRGRLLPPVDSDRHICSPDSCCRNGNESFLCIIEWCHCLRNAHDLGLHQFRGRQFDFLAFSRDGLTCRVKRVVCEC